VPVSVTQNIELCARPLSGITVVFIKEKEPKYRTVRLNTKHLATPRQRNEKERKYDYKFMNFAKIVLNMHNIVIERLSLITNK